MNEELLSGTLLKKIHNDTLYVILHLSANYFITREYIALRSDGKICCINIPFSSIRQRFVKVD